MSQESKDQHSMKEETVETELEPRAATQVVTTLEAHNNIAEPCSPQADTDNDQAFPSKSPGKAGVAWNQDPGSTSHNVASSSTSSNVSGRLRQEKVADVGAHGDSSNNGIDESLNLTHLDDRILLYSIKRQILSRLSYKPDGNIIRGSEPRVMRFGVGIGTEEIAELLWPSVKQISDAWPRNRNVEGVKQFTSKQQSGNIVVQSPRSPVERLDLPHEETQRYAAFESMWFGWCHAANWQQIKSSGAISPYSAAGDDIKGKIVFRNGFQCFPISLIACAFSFEEPFGVPDNRRDNSGVGYSASFLTKNFRGGYSIETDHHLHDTIHWQIRYFSPMEETPYNPVTCLLSKRQTVTMRYQGKNVDLQERRARISFRVPKESPEIFSILVLTDDETSPDTYNPDSGYQFFGESIRKLEDGWILPIEHFVLEIYRVFKFSMESWGETLDSIDELVHVKLQDLNEPTKVEELMFDNSFKRSRDYFVALQLLRIIEEWLDEVQTAVQDMLNNPMLGDTSIWLNNSGSSSKAAIKFIEKHAATVRNRVGDKKEEINSLRDGLFNATSLRESTKAMALNRAIYVFTVVTVLFTPVSFLATFWALPFLNNPTEGTDVVPVPSAFRNSFIVMPLLTYALVIGVAWFVGKRHNADEVLSMVTELGQSTGRLVKSGWNLLKEKSKNRNGRSPFP